MHRLCSVSRGLWAADGVPSFAGLYELWPDPAKDVDDPDRWVWSAAVITHHATSLAGVMNERTPVILPLDRIDAWLDPELTDKDAIRKLISGIECEPLQVRAVSTAVNKTGRGASRGPELIEPIDDTVTSEALSSWCVGAAETDGGPPVAAVGGLRPSLVMSFHRPGAAAISRSTIAWASYSRVNSWCTSRPSALCRARTTQRWPSEVSQMSRRAARSRSPFHHRATRSTSGRYRTSVMGRGTLTRVADQRSGCALGPDTTGRPRARPAANIRRGARVP
jgi:hypothetical protein